MRPPDFVLISSFVCSSELQKFAICTLTSSSIEVLVMIKSRFVWRFLCMQTHFGPPHRVVTLVLVTMKKISHITRIWTVNTKWKWIMNSLLNAEEPNIALHCDCDYRIECNRAKAPLFIWATLCFELLQLKTQFTNRWWRREREQGRLTMTKAIVELEFM